MSASRSAPQCGEFSPEQDIMVSVLRIAGVLDPATVVRGNLLGASYFGSFLRPLLLHRAAVSRAQDEAMAAEMVAEIRHGTSDG